MERRAVQLEIERQALIKEKDAASRERRTIIERELSTLKEQAASMKAQWQNEKSALGDVGKLKQQIEEARTEADRVTRAGDLGKAAEIQYGTVPALEAKLRFKPSIERV